MLKSMTGYGRSIYESEKRKFIIEIKSVNHKYNDISIRMNKNISYLENTIRKKVKENISRGKLDIHITMEELEIDKKNKINKKLAETYISDIKEISQENNTEIIINMSDILMIPDILCSNDNEEDKDIEKELLKGLDIAINSFIDMRIKEGEKIREDLLNRLDVINKYINEINSYSTGLVEEYIVKLKKRIKEILKEDIIDENRLSMEVVIFADKCSIEEEITRLNSHIEQFKNMLDDNNIGKKMDFLIQEMNREINTIASKANCLNITKLVVEVKSELENIREQVQNIE